MRPILRLNTILSFSGGEDDPRELLGKAVQHVAALHRATRETIMTVLEQQQPLTLPISLYEDPPGVLRVGNDRVLLELMPAFA